MEKSNELVFYNSIDLFDRSASTVLRDLEEKVDGIKLFSNMFNVFAANMTLHDRTGTITTPVRTHLLPFLAMPEFNKIDKSFEQICEERAKELLQLSIKSNRKIVIMYSGGIDSTLIVVAFMKICTQRELKQNFVVLMNDGSVCENRNFYNNYIKKYMHVDVSYKFPFYVGHPNYIVVTGEGNDQLFGSAVSRIYMVDRGSEELFSEINNDIVRDFITRKMYSNLEKSKQTELSRFERDGDRIFRILQEVIDKSPVPITTPYQYFWWINFTLKWQSVYVRILSFVEGIRRNTIRLEDNFFMFFSSPDFQLWAMNNTDKLIGNTWNTYKQPCKEIIYNFNKDSEYYREKVKMGSLAKIVIQKKSVYAIDTNMQFHETFPGYEFFTNNNTFAEYAKK
jgi:hypothetical protein